MSWLFGSALRSTMVTPDRALAGRPDYPYAVPTTHAVLGTPLAGPWPEGTAVIHLALGCFWGAEREMWRTPGVVTTAAGYQGGFTPFPTYEEVCTGQTGHTETVLVAYDPAVLTHEDLLRKFWELHDPTQGFRQGNDVGTQYRSAIFTTTDEQATIAARLKAEYQPRLTEAGFGEITTELRPAEDAGRFYYAEEYHQQYLEKNPNGYCPVHSTGVACRVS